METTNEKIAALESTIVAIQHQIANGPITIPIQSLNDDQLVVIKEILAVVQEDEGAFVATFFDANINASGDSQIEAVEMLKEMLASSYRLFVNREQELGTRPRQQLATLRKHIAKI
ncbi:MAG: hypothetical protein SGJ20_14535 [Planctomycetota bacterium]|nr:hypothetical protein [Planctomycetota bacterium]